MSAFVFTFNEPSALIARAFPVAPYNDVLNCPVFTLRNLSQVVPLYANPNPATACACVAVEIASEFGYVETTPLGVAISAKLA